MDYERIDWWNMENKNIIPDNWVTENKMYKPELTKEDFDKWHFCLKEPRVRRLKRFIAYLASLISKPFKRK